MFGPISETAYKVIPTKAIDPNEQVAEVAYKHIDTFIDGFEHFFDIFF
jgi:hypothetical protein